MNSAVIGTGTTSINFMHWFQTVCNHLQKKYIEEKFLSKEILKKKIDLL